MYGTLMILWQCSFWLGRRHEVKRTVVFIIIADNAENDIEGVLRRVYHKCRNLDYPSRVYVIDVASTDLTVPITYRFKQKCMQLELRHAPSYEEAQVIANQIGEGIPESICCLMQVRGNQVASTIVR